MEDEENFRMDLSLFFWYCTLFFGLKSDSRKSAKTIMMLGFSSGRSQWWLWRWRFFDTFLFVVPFWGGAFCRFRLLWSIFCVLLASLLHPLYATQTAKVVRKKEDKKCLLGLNRFPFVGLDDRLGDSLSRWSFGCVIVSFGALTNGERRVYVRSTYVPSSGTSKQKLKTLQIPFFFFTTRFEWVVGGIENYLTQNKSIMIFFCLRRWCFFFTTAFYFLAQWYSFT